MASQKETIGDSNILRDEGDVWFVYSVADGRGARLRASVGMPLLARVIGSPGREWHALDLSSSGLVGGQSPSVGLDDAAKDTYRRRVIDLRAEIAEAEDFNDEERAGRLRDELGAVTAEIARAVGLNDRDRSTGTAGERARVRVTRALRTAISRIEQELPLLGAHLQRAVRTGAYCCYQQDPVSPAAPWVTDDGARLVHAGQSETGAPATAYSPAVERGMYVFLFTDLEDSTPRWEQYPEEMTVAAARHDELVRRAVAEGGGRVFSTGGDGFATVFATPASALDAAIDIQRALASEPWPEGAEMRVRMGLHVGVAELRDTEYFGVEVNRAARVAAAGHGGQILVTSAIAEMLADRRQRDIELVDLGEYDLKGLSRPERIFQVVTAGLDPTVRLLRVRLVSIGNLPVPSTAFVGRERELVELGTEIRRRRLVTLAGPGGVGKTRLALEACSRMSDRFRDGVWFFELAPVSGDDDVAFVISNALRLPPQEGLTTIDWVVDSLQGRETLLLIDNCEHVLDAVATLVSQVMRKCDRVTVVATSREPLGVEGERLWPVEGLEVTVDAPALFWDRATVADNHATLMSAEAADVAAICHGLDGMPLAIELAAARTTSMTVSEIAARLDDRFRLLRSPGRDRPSRHQNLLAALDWSYQLLGDDERLLFDRLSVFPGSFDRAAALAVCAGRPIDGAAMDELLDQLVGKSMVIADRSSGPTTRFLLLETLRQFGSAHLDKQQAVELTSTHLHYYLDVCQHANALLTGPGVDEGQSIFRTEWHNFRAAVHQASISGARSATHSYLDWLFWYADALGLVEVGAWAETAIAVLGPDPLLLGVAGYFAILRGESAEAQRFAEQGIAASLGAEDPDTLHCWQTLQMVHWYGGNPLEAFKATVCAVAIAELLNDRYAASYFHGVAGGTASWAGQPDAAAHLSRQSDLIASNNPTLKMLSEFMTASNAWIEGELDEALRGFSEAAEMAAACGAIAWEFRALAAVVRLAGTVGGSVPDTICHDVLTRLYEAGSWNDVWFVLELLFVTWANAGHIEESGVLLGYLEAFDRHHTIAATERMSAATQVKANPDGAAALVIGAGLDRDQLVTYVLEHLAPSGQ